MVTTVEAAAPQTTIYLNGSGTYTTPSGALYLDVELIGPGGPGSGSGTTPGNGTVSASDTTFGALTAGKGQAASGTTGGAGGTPTGGDENITGQPGMNAASGYTFAVGGKGGGPYGGTGFQGNNGPNGLTNTGGGGAGGGADSAASPGAGGGEGAIVRKRFSPPAASYAYNVGPASVGGAAGTSGRTGGAGASGRIKITAYFQ